jgi:hypothetical protein
MMMFRLCHFLLFATLCGRVTGAPADIAADCEGWANSGECDKVQ